MDNLVDRLGGGMGGRVRPPTDDEATDFGRHLRATPRGVVEARDEADVQATVRAVGAAGLPLVVRGAGHSCDGQTVTDGVILRVAGGVEDAALVGDVVEVAAGARWSELERWLNARGRASPVLTDYLDLTVGGTLSVGGYGVRSVRLGAQVDHCEALRVVTPDGAARWCSPTVEPALFSHALAGEGRVGVITRARLRTVPLLRTLRWHLFAHGTLAAAASSAGPLAEGDGAPDAFQVATVRGSRLPMGVATSWFGYLHGDVPAGDDPVRAPRGALPLQGEAVRDYPFVSHTRRAAFVAARPGCARLWADHVVDAAGFAPLLASVDALLRDGGRCVGAVYGIAIRRAAGALVAPFEAGGSGPATRFGVGVYWFVPEADDGARAEAGAEARALAAEARRLGGRPYRYGRHALQADDERALYGAALDARLDLQRAHGGAGWFGPAPHHT